MPRELCLSLLVTLWSKLGRSFRDLETMESRVGECRKRHGLGMSKMPSSPDFRVLLLGILRHLI